jgi:hypothetical protein
VVGIKHNNRKENCAGSEDVTRDHRCAHLGPSVTPLARRSRLMRRRRYSHVDGSEDVTHDHALGMPPLARTRAPLRIEEPPPPRVEVMELRPPAWKLPHKGAAAARPLDRPPPPRRPGNRRHRMSRSGSHDHRSHLPGSTAARAIGQPPSLMNRDGA